MLFDFTIRLQAYLKSRARSRLHLVENVCNLLDDVEKSLHTMASDTWKFRLTLRRQCVYSMEMVVAFVQEKDWPAINLVLAKETLQADEVLLVVATMMTEEDLRGMLEGCPKLKEFATKHKDYVDGLLAKEQGKAWLGAALEEPVDPEAVREALMKLGLSKEKMEVMLSTLTPQKETTNLHLQSKHP